MKSSEVWTNMKACGYSPMAVFGVNVTLMILMMDTRETIEMVTSIGINTGLKNSVLMRHIPYTA